MKKKMTSLVSALFAFGMVQAADITVSDSVGSGEVYWTADNVYLLSGRVFVESGASLYIEPGTVVKGMPGQGDNSSALIVAQNAKIYAEGTADQPIIFTFEADPLDGSTPVTTKGQWGGVIILGNAQLNSTPGTSSIEGIPTTELRAQYGGNDDMDNSGVFKYVSIRHGGSDIGAGNEINGLTLGGVGSGTELDFVEVIANADDGVEFFGGAAHLKHAVVAFCGDDSFDYDEGFRGKGQYWFTVHGAGNGDRAGEHDGGTDPEDGIPYAHPMVYNATYIGRGVDAGKRTISFRDNAGGEYHNSIFYNFAKGIDVENLADGEDSYERLLEGSLQVSNNVFDNVATDIWAIAGEALTDADAAAFEEIFSSNNNEVASTGLTWTEMEVNVVPTANVATSFISNDVWFDTVDYKGAFAPSTEPWLAGWTLLDQVGFISQVEVGIDDKLTLEAHVYPNPVLNQMVKIDFEEAIQGAYKLVNALGQVQSKGLINGSTLTVEGITSKGIYFIQIEWNNSTLTKQVVKI